MKEEREYERLHSLDQLGKSIIGNLRQPIPGCLEFTYLGSLAPGGGKIENVRYRYRERVGGMSDLMFGKRDTLADVTTQGPPREFP